MERFSYFMIRVSQPTESGVAMPTSLTGVVERLASREKRTFGSGEELLRLVAEWPDDGANRPEDTKS